PWLVPSLNQSVVPMTKTPLDDADAAASVITVWAARSIAWIGCWTETKYSIPFSGSAVMGRGVPNPAVAKSPSPYVADGEPTSVPTAPLARSIVRIAEL